jgi:quinoprotein glucose dehydrogenase
MSRRVGAGVVLLALVLAASAAVSYRAWKRSQNRFKPVIGTNEDALRPTVGAGPTLPAVIERSEMTDFRIDEVARGLRIVWSVRVAPDGRVFLSERAGKLSVLMPGAGHPVLYASLSTALGGESGLMGVALHPRFPAEPFVYVMYTARKPGGGVNRVSRLRDTPDGGVDEQILIDDIPASRNHDGGALEFGPDGMLYVGTGDAAVPALAQDLQQPSGKILRVAPDGSIPVDNPIPGSPVWAYGFRNVSGLAFHPQTGELWAATHGPSGVAEDEPKHMDAIFVVRKGGNHGWPTHLGASDDPAIVSPVIFFRDRAVPPGGMMFYDAPGPYQQSLFLTSLRGQALYRFVIAEGRRVERVERWWPDRFGRLRAIGRGPNGTLYIGTSNQDLRASREYPGSDYLLRLTPTVTP